MSSFWLLADTFGARWGAITEGSLTAVSDYAAAILGEPDSMTSTDGENLGRFSIVGNQSTRHWNQATDAQLDAITEYVTRLLGAPDTVV